MNDHPHLLARLKSRTRAFNLTLTHTLTHAHTHSHTHTLSLSLSLIVCLATRRKPYFHPIFGCLRYAGPGKGYEVYKRVVKKDPETGEKEEKYCFTRSFDRVPGPPQITDCISMSVSF